MSPKDPYEVKRLLENWQRCRPEMLSGLFYAYDEEQAQIERVVTYEIKEDAMKALLDTVKTNNGVPEKGFRFVIQLGVNAEMETLEVPNSPAFSLHIQAFNHGDDNFANCFEMSWQKNSKFSLVESKETRSENNAMPAAGAYIFVQSWMEYPEADLAEPFTAVSRVLGKRPKCYLFSYAESKSIYQDMVNSLSSDKPGVHVHLGNGLAVWDHPFSFRPVIEVLNAVDESNEASLITARDATGLTDGKGGSYYDYAVPDPPGFPDDPDDPDGGSGGSGGGGGF